LTAHDPSAAGDPASAGPLFVLRDEVGIGMGSRRQAGVIPPDWSRDQLVHRRGLTRPDGGTKGIRPRRQERDLACTGIAASITMPNRTSEVLAAEDRRREAVRIFI